MCWETLAPRFSVTYNHPEKLLGNTKKAKLSAMPKSALYTIMWSSEQGAYLLYTRDHPDAPLLQGDPEPWLTWLTSHPSFSFQGRHGHLNLQKEKRLRGDEGYWYAYRRQEKRIVKKYVGRSADLSIARLEELAQALAIRASESPPDDEPRRPRKDEIGREFHTPPGETLDGTHQRLGSTPLFPSFTPAPLLISKLSPPRLPAALIERPRLLARLDEGFLRKLVLMSAPAGYGKTTLVSQWVASLRERQLAPSLAWLSLDATDNDPFRFWHAVILACQVFQKGLAHSAHALLSLGQQPPFELPDLETVLTLLLNDIAALPQNHLLVLEDYHVITFPQIHQTMAFFLDHLPATLHLMLITRSDPPLPLARWRVRDELTELRTPDVHFSREETRRFLVQAAPFPLADEVIRHLDVQVEGWAAGLRLLVLALQGCRSESEIKRLLATFAGSHRSIVEYFVTELLQNQPEHLQLFLLQTSVLSRLTGSLCDAVTRRDDSAHLLESMERAGLFLEWLEGAGRAEAWYRYHPLFVEAMSVEACRRLGENALHTLSARASLWYEHHQMFPEAIRMALRTQEPVRAAGLLARVVDTVPFQEGYAFHALRDLLEQLPEEVLSQYPTLCLSEATALLLACSSEQLPKTSEARIEQLLQMAEQGFQAQEKTARLGQVCAFRSLVAHRQGETSRAGIWARQALARLPAEASAWQCVSLGIVGVEAFHAGRLHEARSTLLEAQHLCQAIENRQLSRTVAAMLGQVSFEQGALHQAAEYFHQALVEARTQEDCSDICHALLGLARLSYEWNALQASEQEAQEAFALSEQLEDEELQVQAMLVLTDVLHAQGRTTEALRRCASLLARMAVISFHSSPHHFRTLETRQARLQLAIGDFSAVERWATTRAFTNEALLPLQQEQEELLVARWLLAQGKAEEALRLLGRLFAAASASGRRRSALAIQVVMALISAAHKQIDEARQQLQAVFSFVHAEGYLRLFLDEGEPMAALLCTMFSSLREKLQMSYLQVVLQAFPEAQTTSGISSPISPSSFIEPLSPQEQRVLRLLGTGRSNAEIAQELVVSINTIRTQVQSIYRKLQVKNRVEASQTARFLHLFSR